MILSSVAFCDDHRPPGRVIPEIPILEPGSAGGLGLIDATSNAGVFARSCAETRAQTNQTMRRTPHAVLMRESYARPECIATWMALRTRTPCAPRRRSTRQGRDADQNVTMDARNSRLGGANAFAVPKNGLGD